VKSRADQQSRARAILQASLKPIKLSLAGIVPVAAAQQFGRARSGEGGATVRSRRTWSNRQWGPEASDRRRRRQAQSKKQRDETSGPSGVQSATEAVTRSKIGAADPWAEGDDSPGKPDGGVQKQPLMVEGRTQRNKEPRMNDQWR
jgi:hypothetical protein